MIYTLTMNPSLDYLMDVPQLQVGAINRSQDEQTLIGGKGINVSLLVSRLGLPTCALGYIAGFTGQEIVRQLDAYQCPHQFITLDKGFSRINVKVAGQTETAINGNGPIITEEDLNQLLTHIKSLTAEDTLILSGSIPSSLPKTLYASLAAISQEKGVKVIVDATGQLLQDTLPYGPFLIKPNDEELAELSGQPCQTQESILSAAQALQKQGAQNILVSRGNKGAILITKDGGIFSMGVPKGQLVSSVGAGDSMVAGFITGYYLSHGDWKTALQYGTAAGAATAFTAHIATKEQFHNLLSIVQKDLS